MPEDEVVHYERRGAAAILTIDYQERLNALSAGVQAGLLAALRRADDDADVRAIIVTGTGRAFCAGGDISSFDLDIYQARRMQHAIKAFFHAFEKIPKPIIAAVNGFALGGGMELTISCDFAIASEKATFATPEPSIGVMPGYAVLRLHHIVGRPRAKEILMTGRKLSAQEALDWGIVNAVAPHDELLKHAEEFAATLAKQAPIPLSLIKSIVNRDLGGPDLAHSIDAAVLQWATEDQKEGMRAFLDKRPPEFKGR
jgi:enoyl-CoA hydratase